MKLRTISSMFSIHTRKEKGMKRRASTALIGVAAAAGLISPVPSRTQASESACVSILRLYNPVSGEHFYTSNETEKTCLLKAGWLDEGFGWYSPHSSEVPVYRLYNPNAGDHHYTISEKERNYLAAHGWRYEGIGWYSSTDENALPVYRQYNTNAKTGNHNFTANETENRFLKEIGWNQEGIGWYCETKTAKLVAEASLELDTLNDYASPVQLAKRALKEGEKVNSCFMTVHSNIVLTESVKHHAFMISGDSLYSVTFDPDAGRTEISKKQLKFPEHGLGDEDFLYGNKNLRASISWGDEGSKGKIESVSSADDEYFPVSEPNPYRSGLLIADTNASFRFAKKTENSVQIEVTANQGWDPGNGSPVVYRKDIVTIDHDFHIREIHETWENGDPASIPDIETVHCSRFNERILNPAEIDRFFDLAGKLEIQKDDRVNEEDFPSIASLKKDLINE